MRSAVYIILMAVLLSLLVGCTDEPQENNTCAICGSEANEHIMGPASYMKSIGIDLSKCRMVTSDVYSAYLCDDCNTIPVHEITPRG